MSPFLVFVLIIITTSFFKNNIYTVYSFCYYYKRNSIIVNIDRSVW